MNTAPAHWRKHGTLELPCSKPGCHVADDGISDCGQDACAHCGASGTTSVLFGWAEGRPVEFARCGECGGKTELC